LRRISGYQQDRGDIMLYQDKPLGRGWIGARLGLRLLSALSGRRFADLDLLSMSPHLRRDLGIEDDASSRALFDAWRK
jgi:hypothetical protein